jgi:flavin-dependent dehydrogenase
MLLAQKGYRVLLVDKATFPSDTLSTHIVHANGVAALKRWNLLDRVLATGCPPIPKYSFDFGPFALVGPPLAVDGVAFGLCPRRTVFDKVLVDGAVEAGAELKEGFVVDEVVIENGAAVGIRGRTKGGASDTYRGRVVIGADGLHSAVAKAVQAPRYNERPIFAATFYGYWSGLPADRFEAYIRPRRAFLVIPTNDGLTLGAINWPRSEFEANRGDVEGHFHRAWETAPALHDRTRNAKLETRLWGTGDLPNFFCKPYGAGWALVGDAGYHKDPVTATGISDAFWEAESLTSAIDDAFSGRRSYEEALASHQRARDEHFMPRYDFTCQLANLEEPPPPEMQQLLGAISGNPEAMTGFVSTFSGILSPAEFLAPENVGRIMAAAQARAST